MGDNKNKKISRDCYGEIERDVIGNHCETCVYFDTRSSKPTCPINDCIYHIALETKECNCCDEIGGTCEKINGLDAIHIPLGLEGTVTYKGLPQQDSLKFDAQKLRLDLIPIEVTEELGKVLTYGLQKGYKEDSWKQVEKYRYEAAALRHFVAYKKGEVFDKESNLRHLSHLLTNITFLLWKEIHGE